MWKTITPGEKLAPGDTIRYQPSSSGSFYRDKIYEVVKAEVHYCEVVARRDSDEPGDSTDRKVIKYMDIGYNIALELWSAPKGHVAAGRKIQA